MRSLQRSVLAITLLGLLLAELKGLTLLSQVGLPYASGSPVGVVIWLKWLPRAKPVYPPVNSVVQSLWRTGRKEGVR